MSTNTKPDSSLFVVIPGGKGLVGDCIIDRLKEIVNGGEGGGAGGKSVVVKVLTRSKSEEGGEKVR